MPKNEIFDNKSFSIVYEYCNNINEKRDIKKPEKAMEVWNLGLISLNENLFLFPLKSLPQNNEKQTPL